MTSPKQFDGGYFLAHIFDRVEAVPDAAAPEPSESSLVLNLVSEMTGDEVQQFRNDIRAISQYEASEHLISFVRDNLVDLLDNIANHGYDFDQRRTTSATIMESAQLEISRLLSNVLSAFKSVLDHGETYFSRTYGKNSSEFLAWKSAQKTEFDTVFAYRFFYALRNFTQHIDAAPINLKFKAEANKEAVTMRVDLDRESLLRDGGDKFKRLEVEILAMPGPLSLVELLEPWSDSFERLAAYYLGQRAKEALPHSLRLLDLRTRIAKDYGQLAMASVGPTEIPPRELSTSLQHVPETTARRIAGREAA